MVETNVRALPARICVSVGRPVDVMDLGFCNQTDQTGAQNQIVGVGGFRREAPRNFGFFFGSLTEFGEMSYSKSGIYGLQTLIKYRKKHGIHFF